ncbi:MAG: DUF4397 domain-containing protein [Chloroflexota bacterium]|nr:DUF4397 domain-containing protein [Chloroflexota bacterium]
MRIGKTRALRTALYGIALAALLMAIILPTVAAKSTAQFRVRFLNAVPDSTGVDVVIDSVQIANNAPFKTLGAYITATEGNYALSVYPTGRRSQSAAYVYKRGFAFSAPKDYTIIVLGRQADNSVDASIEIDHNTLDGSNNASVRFGNYLPGTGTLTLVTDGTNTVLGNARSGQTDNYTAIAAGTYALALHDGNGGVVTKTDAVTLGPNTTVSVFALGLAGGTPAPSLLINTDNGAAPVQATATPATTPTTAPSPSVPAPPPVTPSPTSAASAALRQAFQPVPSITNTDTKVFYAATGHTLGGVFKTYWDSHGGLAQFGYPITEEYQEVSLTDGKTYTTQYFERARFEQHPENKGTPYEVLQGLLGREMFKLLGVG